MSVDGLSSIITIGATRDTAELDCGNDGTPVFLELPNEIAFDHTWRQ